MARTSEEIRQERERLEEEIDEIREAFQKKLDDGPVAKIRDLVLECEKLGHPNAKHVKEDEGDDDSHPSIDCPDCGKSTPDTG